MAVSKRIESKLQRREKRFETEQMMKIKRSEDYDVLEEVFDRSTLMTVYSLLNRNVVKQISGVVGSGKESRIYYGVDLNGEGLAIKIYLIVSAEFKRMLPYIQGDSRFKHVKQGRRSLVYAWAQKEFKNLQKAYSSGVRVPRPIHIEKNVLIMEFIGDERIPAPLLKDKLPRHPKKMYDLLLNYVKVLYQKADLVHADLSEYNIMNYDEDAVIFDFSQSTLIEHPMANQFLLKDISNLNNFFSKLGIRTRRTEDICKWVTKR